ncbi:hypothetical protein B0T26DRAFT_660295 [Lasiosphaeria miniovina]|uniref:Uncharacterized protein n=1 Tax=Lasiosphaeria miniovina TaxID=1954250 RepID=A0AA40DG53_9PEZI|nr:uncharacterized protein B0T26DRAFT_660295 [Lasiosphaeria miniovina]KAK0701825.1 hypothetical protein B0T26DRAFT_660295 [Lasiosphaeria miniovina]
MTLDDAADTIFPLPGSIPKAWDPEELRRCGAVETSLRASFDLEGEVHPVFCNWDMSGDGDAGEELMLRELHQPLLLASRLLEGAGLPWLSEFLIDDIFGASYPGLPPPALPDSHHGEVDKESDINSICQSRTPVVIVRHHRAAWATPRLVRTWLDATARELRTALPRCVLWQLDGVMFAAFGWVGYTCRHLLREGTGGVDSNVDHPNVIRDADAEARRRGVPSRFLTVLVIREYTARLCALRQLGQFGGEEYMLTAFMLAVTALHELGHAIYWKDLRAANRCMNEPYFGGDLEMELGDSFIASIFGDWTPVPIEHTHDEFGWRGTFERGLAWKQHLTWDFHRTRPRYRAHYSIPVK